MGQKTFSILHTSARPDQWRKIYDAWMAAADGPAEVEYVLCVDPRWGFTLDPANYENWLDNIVVVQNTGRRCYVDGVNLAAVASSGAILIVNADDQYPCEHWDTELSRAIEFSKIGKGGSGSFVVECNEGGREHERRIMPMPILSRARYDQQGYVFYPEYESMCADNDFFESAYQDGVVIDARHLLFPHRHPLFDSSIPPDEQYAAQNSQDAYQLGKGVFARRKASGFPPMARPVPKRLIALALPGEVFQGAYLDMILQLQGHLLCRHFEFEVVTLRAYTSNPYITRADIARAAANMEVKPELILWLDDDNLLSIEHFERLLSAIDANGDVDAVAGWCWIHDPNKENFYPSCGMWAPDMLHWDPFPPTFAHKRGLQPFQVGGFPCVLMRYSALEKAEPFGGFLPVVDNRLPHGLAGEDISFWKHCAEGGGKFLVDPQVRLPHLKYVTVEPVLPAEGKTDVKVACMMRVKNEARWIKRTIDSVRELCGDLIFVMEDGSIDGTREIAESLGAVVLPSPYVGMGLNESRDKDWLLQEVIARCNPDWVLMPDGDEELEAGGCAIIRRVLEGNPNCDSIALGFLYIWDTIDQYRCDGVYGTMGRQSLFRANKDFRFRSYYDEGETANQNHVGLHTSNAPNLGGVVARLHVNLLHYGYMHKEDRIRKYEWITSIDPHNEGEGFYLHCVQGDVPQVPADMVLKHAGPLAFKKFPPNKIPRWEGPVPGPWDPKQAERKRGESRTFHHLESCDCGTCRDAEGKQHPVMMWTGSI